jgi:hypothetical protein
MHFVKKLGKALDLIHAHPRAGPLPAEQIGKHPWPRKKVLIEALIQQIDSPRVWEMGSKPGALPGSPSAKQEKGALWREQEARKNLGV